MNFVRLLWMSLRRRPIRAAFTTLSAAVAFTLFGLLHGTTAVFSAVIDSAQLNRLYITSRNGLAQPLPINHARRVAQMQGAEAVTHLSLLVGRIGNDSSPSVGYAIDPQTYFVVYSDWQVDPQQLQRMKQVRTAALVGGELARKRGWSIGDRIPMTTPAGHFDFEVAGFYNVQDASQENVVLVHHALIEPSRAASPQLVGTADLLVARAQSASQAAALAAAIDTEFENSPAQTRTQNEKEWAQAQLTQIGDLNVIVNGILGAVFFALAFLTASSMMQSTQERLTELGVLKVLGYSDGYVSSLVVAEPLAICTAAAAIGVTAAAYLFPLLQSMAAGVSTLPSSVPLQALLVALGIAALSAVAPLWKTLRTPLVSVLAKG